MQKITEVVLGGQICLADLVAVSRHGAKVSFSDEYRRRVEASHALLQKMVDEERVVYGVTTGFGALCGTAIGKEDASLLQRNILLSHATSVGAAMPAEAVRATLFMVLQNLGQGHSGVRMRVLEQYAAFLNAGLTPFAPMEGSVGYLCPEAHMALVLLGEGQASVDGQLLPGARALAAAGLAPLVLGPKEGLALISGTTACTGMAALSLHDMLNAAEAADIIGGMSLEACRGVLAAFDERVMAVRPHVEQAQTAARLRAMLADSEILQNAAGEKVQDALSLRCIPQLHGAAKKTLRDAQETVETEMNSCCDNPILWDADAGGASLAAGNADSAYIGLEMDSAAIAATMLAKMSERRNSRLIDPALSGLPAFLAAQPGLNSGLMIPQYTQAGLLGDMRILCTPSVIDNTPTCTGQEDYVAMGYNAAKKAMAVAKKLEYVLAIELLSAHSAQPFLGEAKPAAATARIVTELERHIPHRQEDFFLHPAIEYLRDFIHTGELARLAE